MATKLGQAFAFINIDLAGFQAQMGKAHVAFTSGIQKMQAVANQAKIALLAGAAGVGVITKIAANFEQGMARVKALTGESGAAFDAMRNQAKELGATTVFSARQAADAMGFFALAGFKSEKIMASMPATLNLAAAGQLDVAQAADITAKIMAGMGLEAADLTHTVDVLAKAFTTSNTDLVQLGGAMKFVGPVGKAAGKSIEELTAAVQVMSNAGIQGQMAGTSLRNILLRLQSQPREVAGALKDMGITIADSAGKMKPLAQIIDEVNAATSEMGDVQRNAVIGQLAGTRAVAGFLALMEQGGDQIRKFESALQGSTGTAERIATVQLDTLQGQFIKLKSAAEGAAITFGEKMLPAIRKLVVTITTWTAGLSKWDEASVQNAISTAKLVAKLLILLVALPKVAIAMRAVVAVMSGAALNPAVLAVIALTTAVTLLGGAWVESRIKGESFVDTLKHNIDAMLGLNKVTQDQIDLQKARAALAAKPDPSDPQAAAKKFTAAKKIQAIAIREERKAREKVERIRAESFGFVQGARELGFAFQQPASLVGGLSRQEQAERDLKMAERRLKGANQVIAEMTAVRPEFGPATRTKVAPAEPAAFARERQARRAAEQADLIARRRRRREQAVVDFGAAIDAGVREAQSAQSVAERKAIEARMETRGAAIAALEKPPERVSFSGLQEFAKSIQTSLFDTAEESRDKEKLKLLKEAQAKDAKRNTELEKIAENTKGIGKGLGT